MIIGVIRTLGNSQILSNREWAIYIDYIIAHPTFIFINTHLLQYKQKIALNGYNLTYRDEIELFTLLSTLDAGSRLTLQQLTNQGFRATPRQLLQHINYLVSTQIIGGLATPELYLLSDTQEIHYAIVQVDVNATGGVLEYSLDEITWYNVPSYTSGNLNGTHTGLINGITYYYRYKSTATFYTDSAYTEEEAMPLPAIEQFVEAVLEQYNVEYGTSHTLEDYRANPSLLDVSVTDTVKGKGTIAGSPTTYYFTLLGDVVSKWTFYIGKSFRKRAVTTNAVQGTVSFLILGVEIDGSDTRVIVRENNSTGTFTTSGTIELNQYPFFFTYDFTDATNRQMRVDPTNTSNGFYVWQNEGDETNNDNQIYAHYDSSRLLGRVNRTSELASGWTFSRAQNTLTENNTLITYSQNSASGVGSIGNFLRRDDFFISRQYFYLKITVTNLVGCSLIVDNGSGNSTTYDRAFSITANGTYIIKSKCLIDDLSIRIWRDVDFTTVTLKIEEVSNIVNNYLSSNSLNRTTTIDSVTAIGTISGSPDTYYFKFSGDVQAKWSNYIGKIVTKLSTTNSIQGTFTVIGVDIDAGDTRLIVSEDNSSTTANGSVRIWTSLRGQIRNIGTGELINEGAAYVVLSKETSGAVGTHSFLIEGDNVAAITPDLNSNIFPKTPISPTAASLADSEITCTATAATLETGNTRVTVAEDISSGSVTATGWLSQDHFLTGEKIPVTPHTGDTMMFAKFNNTETSTAAQKLSDDMVYHASFQVSNDRQLQCMRAGRDQVDTDYYAVPINEYVNVVTHCSQGLPFSGKNKKFWINGTQVPDADVIHATEVNNTIGNLTLFVGRNYINQQFQGAIKFYAITNLILTGARLTAAMNAMDAM